jgi:hypothetical protein
LLIASTVRLAPQGLLSFRYQGLLSVRYMEGFVSRISPGDDWEASRDKVAAGMTPVAVAALVTQ